MTLSSDSTLDVLGRKIASGERLSAAEGEFLFRADVDLHGVGELANDMCRKKNGNVVYFNRNAHLNPTNICAYRCELCAYSRDENSQESYVLSMEEILDRGREAADSGCTELHIVGGVHPKKPFDWYLQIVRELHNAFPRLHIKAWTAVEIDWFSKIAERPVQAILEAMLVAGLGSMPGGGAEVFSPEVRLQICSRKADAETWLSVHRTAHHLGLKSNATMLFGHIEKIEHRIDHLLRLRQLQDETGGFQAFIPLSFHPENTRFSHLSRTSALDDLRTVAVSRLMLDNFAHIKAYWISLGIGTAQTALAYGADDLDGTVTQEEIHHAAGSKTPSALSLAEIRHLIAETGHDAVERDSLYRRVRSEGRGESGEGRER